MGAVGDGVISWSESPAARKAATSRSEIDVASAGFVDSYNVNMSIRNEVSSMVHDIPLVSAC